MKIAGNKGAESACQTAGIIDHCLFLIVVLQKNQSQAEFLIPIYLPTKFHAPAYPALLLNIFHYADWELLLIIPEPVTDSTQKELKILN